MKSVRNGAIILLATVLSGCTSLWLGVNDSERRGTSSSLVNYLYPDGLPEQMPYLELPVRVGIAFVPSSRFENFSSADKQLLLTGVADAFRDRPFVSVIEVIPDSYLRTSNGVHGMQQVATLFDVDVMALVSYDQLSLSGDRDSSILYWTVVGALVVKGSVNEVQTMIDTAVFDVATTRLLFRAPGVHRASDNTTLVDVSRDLRNLQQQGFQVATDDMILNLNHELERFLAQVKEGERAEVSWKEGYSGGGSSDFMFCIMLAGLLLVPFVEARAVRPSGNS